MSNPSHIIEVPMHDIPQLELCVHNMICEECGLELDADMEEAVANEVLDEPCTCECHDMI